MEKLRARNDFTETPLTDVQKAEIADTRSLYRARIAELEIHEEAKMKQVATMEELEALKELRGRIDKTIEEGNALTTQDLAVGGHDVIEHLEGGAGPAVGEILRTLLDQVIEDPALNSRDKLMPLVEELAKQRQ